MNMEEYLSRMKAELNKNRRTYEQNKQAMIYNVIIPLFQHLGWDTGNMKEVCPGYKNKAGESDFALIVGASALLLHLYKLGEQLDSPSYVSRLEAQCREERAYGIITDGMGWLFVNPDGKVLAFGALEDDAIGVFIQMLDRRNFTSFGAFGVIVENERKKEPLSAIYHKAMEETSLRQQIKDFEIRIYEAMREYSGPGKDWITPKDVDSFWKDVLCLLIKGGIPESRLLVRFPDGRVFTHMYAKTVFLETIQKIGVQEIYQKANIKVGNHRTNEGRAIDIMLVSQTQPERDHKSLVGSDGMTYYVVTGTSTGDKVNQLNEIRNKLNLKELEIMQFEF